MMRKCMYLANGNVVGWIPEFDGDFALTEKLGEDPTDVALDLPGKIKWRVSLWQQPIYRHKTRHTKLILCGRDTTYI